MSSAGHAITSSRPLSYKRTPIRSFDACRVNGTPADCVALGAHLWEPVDVVLSGINLGSNRETRCGFEHARRRQTGCPARPARHRLDAPVAMGEPNFEVLKPSVEQVLQLILPAPDLTLVNVNFPEGEPTGLRWTRQSVRHYDGKVVPGEDPMGRKHFWFVVIPIEEAEAGTDRWAVEQGYVSLTPLTRPDERGRTSGRPVAISAPLSAWAQDLKRAGRKRGRNLLITGGEYGDGNEDAAEGNSTRLRYRIARRSDRVAGGPLDERRQ